MAAFPGSLQHSVKRIIGFEPKAKHDSAPEERHRD
jgi:hypothetical protein